MSIIVLGSINMDLVVHAPRLPKPGESLIGTSFHTTPGGKGANQAVACARLGIKTHMIGRVGDDVFGDALLKNLAAYGVDTTDVSIEGSQPSGVALIAIDEAAENNIIVVPGANDTVGQSELDYLVSILPDVQVLLLQLEVPMDIVQKAAQLAHQRSITVILDPAPAKQLPAELYPYVDILTPNTTEAGILAGFPVETIEEAEKAADLFLERGARLAIIKMGSMGAYAKDQTGGRFYPAIPVQAVDTVAAGDAFNGALGAALSEGQPFDKAMHWALAAGAIAVTHLGAQKAMPDRKEILEILKLHD
jgi:ribokinase